ncbi:MAG: T9SS type A sorting domain-containing protein [candidate division Zixibacteria bacterium]|nr:T9SS type A sorting domain-containing protein [candidate division Zixibacteria bacterium]
MIEQYEEEIAVIQYHVWWPSSGDPFYQFNIEENTNRNNFYANNYTPHFFVDGDDAGSSYNSWESILMSHYNEPSDWEVEVTGTYDEDTRMVHLDIAVTLHGEDPAGVEFLRAAVCESDIYYQAPNGNNTHNQTFRDMIPDIYGLRIEPDSNGYWEGTIDFELHDEVLSENSNIVFYIQSTRERQIFQGHKIYFDELGPVSVDENGSSTPENYALIGNYPNPFNASTNISYTLADESVVKLDIYNLRGEHVETLIDGIQQPGIQDVNWNAHDMPSGIYFYRLNLNGESFTKTMTLLK